MARAFDFVLTMVLAVAVASGMATTLLAALMVVAVVGVGGVAYVVAPLARRTLTGARR